MQVKISILISLLVLLASCVDEPGQMLFSEDDELTIAAYLEEDSAAYSMFLEVLEIAGFKSAFNAYGTYTLFVSDNDAISEYLSRTGKVSVGDLTKEEAKVLVRYHTLNSIVTSSSLGYGKLPVKNLEDDELVSEFDETGLQGIIINREAKIIHRDIELSNGVIHIIDYTLTPIVQSIVERMEELGNYSLFVDIARETGFYSILNKKYDTVSVDEIRRVYYTVFAESDEVYADSGYNSFQDIEAAYFNGYTDHTDPADSLNKFLANHIINEKAVFLKDFESGNYQTYYGELMSMEIDQDFRINIKGTIENEVYITFILDAVDYQSKNGVFHSIDKVMDIFNPEPAEVIWGFYDQPFARDLVRVNGQNSDIYPNLDLFPNISGTVSGIYVHIPYSNYGFIDNHALILDPPDFDVTIKMPEKIVKGRYKFYLAAKGGSGRATVQIFINDAPIGEPKDLNGGGTWYVTEHFVGEVNLTETQENTIRLVSVSSGMAQLSHVRFEPVE